MYFLMPIERVVFVSSFYFLCSAHLKTGAYCGSHKPLKENLVPCAIYDTSFCRAYLKTPAWPNSDSKEVFLSFLSHSLFCPFLILSAFSKMILENTKPSTGSSFVYGSSTSLELCSF
uniref:Putative secreted protein n=1 Tax=Rhipicephalus microplus TaxID=6941 RepID=A0A6G5A2Q8_RHIMP